MPCECKHSTSLHCRNEPPTSSCDGQQQSENTRPSLPLTFMILSSNSSSSSSRPGAGELISPNVGLIKPGWPRRRTMTRRFGYGYLSLPPRIFRKRPQAAVIGATRIWAAEEASCVALIRLLQEMSSRRRLCGCLSLCLSPFRDVAVHRKTFFMTGVIGHIVLSSNIK